MEFVVLLGKEPSDWADDGGQEDSKQALKIYQTRIVFYNKLLENAYNAYNAYVEQRRHKAYLESVIKDIEDYDPLSPNGDIEMRDYAGRSPVTRVIGRE